MADAGVTILAASLAIRVIPFRRLAARLSRPGNTRSCTSDDARLIRRALEAWSRRLPWRVKCFEQGLAAHWMLGRRGLASTLYYGAATIDGQLTAHVWAMSGSVPVIGCDNRDDFALLARFPTSDPT